MAAKKTPAKKAPDRKTEVLSIRIDPRSRYGLELLARLQRRSTTGVVEWAIHQAFESEIFSNGDYDNEATRLSEELDSLWQINEVERLVALALRKPQLLTFEEARLWKVLRDTSAFWKTQQYPVFDSFRWSELLPQWGKIEPLLNEAVERNIVRGLTVPELATAGVVFAPPAPLRRTLQRVATGLGTPAPDDFADDSDIPF